LIDLVNFIDPSAIAKWLNDNQGVVGVAIFIITLILGWLSGIFSSLRRRPHFRINLIPGPSLVCTFETGDRRDEFAVHRTAIALYLSVSNIGSAPSSIEAVHVGYHWNVIPLTRAWFRYRLGWFWLRDRAASLTDFQVAIGENLKIYPFLFQRNFLSPANPETFLDIGRATNGVVYFEQSDSWGGCHPRSKNSATRIKVRVLDVFGGSHTRVFSVPFVSLDKAREYNPSFGKTLAELNGKPLPADRDA
jgi:hypothetical protein